MPLLPKIEQGKIGQGAVVIPPEVKKRRDVERIRKRDRKVDAPSATVARVKPPKPMGKRRSIVEMARDAIRSKLPVLAVASNPNGQQKKRARRAAKYVTDDLGDPNEDRYAEKRRERRGKKNASDPEKLYKESLERSLASRTENLGEIVQEDRQLSWMKHIMLMNLTRAVGAHTLKERQKQVKAARKIRLAWRIYNVRNLIHIIAFIRVRSSIGWKLSLWVRIVRKRLAVEKIMFVLNEIKRLRTSAALIPIFHQLRWNMIKAQRMVRDYQVCAKARLLLLSKKWDKVRQRIHFMLSLQYSLFYSTLPILIRASLACFQCVCVWVGVFVSGGDKGGGKAVSITRERIQE
jgi:hypothetical protein